MTTTTLHTFDPSDARARLTYGTQALRAVRIDRDADGELSVWLIQVTKKGTDYKRDDAYVWLTLKNSLDTAPWGAELAAYVREIVGVLAPTRTYEYQVRSHGGWRTVAVGLTQVDVENIKERRHDNGSLQVGNIDYRFMNDTP